MEELEDGIFEKLIVEKRHEELIHILKNIFNSINKENSPHLNKIILVLDKIAENQILIPKTIQTLGAAIIKKMETLKTSADWKFTIERNMQGLISEVTAKQQ